MVASGWNRPMYGAPAPRFVVPGAMSTISRAASESNSVPTWTPLRMPRLAPEMPTVFVVVPLEEGGDGGGAGGQNVERRRELRKAYWRRIYMKFSLTHSGAQRYAQTAVQVDAGILTGKISTISLGCLNGTSSSIQP